MRRRPEFVRIQSKGSRVHTPAFTVIALRNEAAGRARLGCAISRKVGSAVVRNRIRRLIKELFRRMAASLPPVDIVIVAKSSAAELAREGFQSVVAMLAPAIEQAARRVTPRPEEAS